MHSLQLAFVGDSWRCQRTTDWECFFGACILYDPPELCATPVFRLCSIRVVHPARKPLPGTPGARGQPTGSTRGSGSRPDDSGRIAVPLVDPPLAARWLRSSCPRRAPYPPQATGHAGRRFLRTVARTGPALESSWSVGCAPRDHLFFGELR
jgi:hypothetical protein